MINKAALVVLIIVATVFWLVGYTDGWIHGKRAADHWYKDHWRGKELHVYENEWNEHIIFLSGTCTPPDAPAYPMNADGLCVPPSGEGRKPQ